MKAGVSYVLIFVGALHGCGDNGADRVDKQPPTTSASPNGGVTRGRIVLTADEPATVYYTTDGSAPTTDSASGPSPMNVDLTSAGTLMFFSVDAIGNTEEVKSLTFDIHKFGPLPLEHINARAMANDIAVKWTKPQDTNQVVVVRSLDAVYKFPEDGREFVVGDSYEGGKVVYVGSDDTFIDAAPGKGGHLYTGFVRATNGAYSEARSAGAAVRSVQEGVIRFDTTAQTATVVTQPTDATVAATNVAVVQPSGDTTFDVTITSTLPSLVFGQKLIFRDFTVAGKVVGVDGAVATQMTAHQVKYPGAAVVAWGPTAMQNGVAVTKRVTIRGLGAPPGTVDVNIALQSDAVSYGAIWTASATTGVNVSDGAVLDGLEGFAPAKPFNNLGNARLMHAYRPGGVSPDGRFLYFGSRNQPRVVKLDAATGREVAGIDLPIASVDGAAGDPELDPSGTRLWVVLNDGMHAAGPRTSPAAYKLRSKGTADNAAYLVELDPATMTETGRLKLGAGDATFRGYRLSVSRDGRRISVPVGRVYDAASVVSIGKVAYINAETRSFFDADPSTPAVDLIDMPDHIRSSHCFFSWAATKLVCNNSFSDNDASDAIGVVDLTQTTLQMTAIDSDPISSGRQKAVTMIANSDGSFWLTGYSRALTKLNADDTIATIGANNFKAESFSFIDPNVDGRLILSDYGKISVVDTSTGVVTQLSTTSPGGFGHRPMVSPY